MSRRSQTISGERTSGKGRKRGGERGLCGVRRALVRAASTGKKRVRVSNLSKGGMDGYSTEYLVFGAEAEAFAEQDGLDHALAV